MGVPDTKRHTQSYTRHDDAKCTNKRQLTQVLNAYTLQVIGMCAFQNNKEKQTTKSRKKPCAVTGRAYDTRHCPKHHKKNTHMKLGPEENDYEGPRPFRGLQTLQIGHSCHCSHCHCQPKFKPGSCVRLQPIKGFLPLKPVQ